MNEIEEKLEQIKNILKNKYDLEAIILFRKLCKKHTKRKQWHRYSYKNKRRNIKNRAIQFKNRIRRYS